MAISQVDLVGNSGRPVVTPQATEQLVNAFRSGFIGVDDIMERVGERAKTKEALDIAQNKQGILDATNPELIQAKKSQQLLAGEQAQQQRDLLPLARRATEEKLNADIRTGQIARYGLKEKLEALNNVGFAPAPDPERGITPEFALEVNKKFGTMLRWQKKKADAIFNSALFDAGELVTPEGATIRGPMDKVTGAPADPKQISQWRKDAAMTLPEFLLAEPGEVVAPIQPSQPTTPIAQAALIQPALPAQQAAAPVIQPSGVPQGFIQVKPAPIVAEKRTDALQRELVNIDLTRDRINTARQLARPGIVGPGQIAPVRGVIQAAAALLPSGLGGKTATDTYTAQRQLDNTISGEIADFVQTWKGAISDKELKFFQAARPSVDSTPELWKRYLDTWEEKNERVRKIVNRQLAPAEPDVWATNPKSAGLGTPGTAPASGPAVPLPASPSAVPTISTAQEYQQLPSGTEYIDPSGKQRRKL